MERYFRALKKAKKKLLGLQNVVGVGIGYKQVRGEETGRPAYIVYVEKKVPPGGLSRGQVVPEQIDGLDVDVVEIGVVRMLGNIRTRRERPCQPGMSVGHYQTTAGTLGALVKDKKTGELMVLSNNHVLANASTVQRARAKQGDPILQPGGCDNPLEPGNRPSGKRQQSRFVFLRRLSEVFDRLGHTELQSRFKFHAGEAPGFPHSFVAEQGQRTVTEGGLYTMYCDRS
ncbi:MAG: hypothetical protein K6T80_01935 [Firmicutes bacterium]|nr:hypothetical protein [Bacillota bacterium]